MTAARKNSLLTGRNWKQNQAIGGRPSVLTIVCDWLYVASSASSVCCQTIWMLRLLQEPSPPSKMQWTTSPGLTSSDGWWWTPGQEIKNLLTPHIINNNCSSRREKLKQIHTHTHTCTHSWLIVTTWLEESSALQSNICCVDRDHSRTFQPVGIYTAVSPHLPFRPWLRPGWRIRPVQVSITWCWSSGIEAKILCPYSVSDHFHQNNDTAFSLPSGTIVGKASSNIPDPLLVNRHYINTASWFWVWTRTFDMILLLYIS